MLLLRESHGGHHSISYRAKTVIKGKGSVVESDPVLIIEGRAYKPLALGMLSYINSVQLRYNPYSYLYLHNKAKVVVKLHSNT